METKSIEQLRNDILLYEKEYDALSAVKDCSDVGPFAERYINKHLNWLKIHIFELQTQIDQIEKD